MTWWVVLSLAWLPISFIKAKKCFPCCVPLHLHLFLLPEICRKIKSWPRFVEERKKKKRGITRISTLPKPLKRQRRKRKEWQGSDRRRERNKVWRVRRRKRQRVMTASCESVKQHLCLYVRLHDEEGMSIFKLRIRTKSDAYRLKIIFHHSVNRRSSSALRFSSRKRLVLLLTRPALPFPLALPIHGAYCASPSARGPCQPTVNN